MSKKNNNDSFFSNQDTIVRRAWIDSALEGVRSRLGVGLEPDPVAGHINGVNIDASDDAPAPTGQPAEAAGESRQPAGLYVAWSSQERRSGT